MCSNLHCTTEGGTSTPIAVASSSTDADASASNSSGAISRTSTGAVEEKPPLARGLVADYAVHESSEGVLTQETMV